MVDDRPAGFACGQNWQTKWTLLEVFFWKPERFKGEFLVYTWRADFQVFLCGPDVGSAARWPC